MGWGDLKSSSPEPLGQFQLDLAQIIHGVGDFSLFKGDCPTPRGDNSERVKIH
jgi:hypothetical protein